MPRRHLASRALFALLLVGCGDASGPGDHIVAGVNLTELFAPPTQSEISATLEDWQQRDVSAQNVQLLDSASVKLGFLNADTVTVRVVSHTVGGVRHFGAVVVPVGATAGSLPLLVMAHPGDAGVDLDATLALLGFTLGGTLEKFVVVVPSFRSEPLVFQGTTYHSEGAPSPWDRDVDDALALLHVAIQITPQADSGRIGVLGLSRGAGVGLLMAVRDPRIDAVVEFFGPTDFFETFVQNVVEEALLGTPRDLPGLTDLDAQFIQPLKRGELSIEDVRSQLVRRSPVYFVDRLPQVQVHHGTADSIVSVSQAERLIEVMRAAGRGPPGFESYLYPGGGHDPFTLPGSVDRAIAFLGRLVVLLGPRLELAVHDAPAEFQAPLYGQLFASVGVARPAASGPQAPARGGDVHLQRPGGRRATQPGGRLDHEAVVFDAAFHRALLTKKQKRPRALPRVSGSLRS